MRDGISNLRPAGLQGSVLSSGRQANLVISAAIHVVLGGVDNGTLKPVLQPARFMSSVYAVSPDGTRIAYVTTQDMTGERLDGTDRRRMVEHAIERARV